MFIPPFTKRVEQRFFDRENAGKKSSGEKVRSQYWGSHQYPGAKICSYSLPLTPDVFY
jgi:hypothetical protein